MNGVWKKGPGADLFVALEEVKGIKVNFYLLTGFTERILLIEPLMQFLNTIPVESAHQHALRMLIGLGDN